MVPLRAGWERGCVRYVTRTCCFYQPAQAGCGRLMTRRRTDVRLPGLTARLIGEQVGRGGSTLVTLLWDRRGRWATGRMGADKKRPPFSAGAKLPWFSLLRELGWRPDGGVAVGAERASGEWLRGLRAAPHRSWMQHPGVMRHPGPPNCFPSAGCARCWS